MLQLSNCASQTKAPPAAVESPVVDIGGPSPPHQYIITFKPNTVAVAGEATQGKKLFSKIARDYQKLAFPCVLVFSLIGPSDPSSSRQALAWGRAEWVTSQLVVAGVPRIDINARAVTITEYDTLHGYPPGPGVVSLQVPTSRLVMIEGSSPYR